MGYHTDFSGKVEVKPPLNPHEISYLMDFNYKDHRDEYGMPGFYCQWVPTKDGCYLEWDGNEKFYDSLEWMQYLIDTFLREDGYAKGEKETGEFTFNHVVNGIIYADGEDKDDIWRLVVRDNVVTREEPMIVWPASEEEDHW